MVGPLPEGNGLLVVYLEAKSGYYPQIIVIDGIRLSIRTSYSNFSNDCPSSSSASAIPLSACEDARGYTPALSPRPSTFRTRPRPAGVKRNFQFHSPRAGTHADTLPQSETDDRLVAGVGDIILQDAYYHHIGSAQRTDTTARTTTGTA